MRVPRRAVVISGATAVMLAVSIVAGSPTSAGVTKDPACSTDIIGRGPGAASGRHLTFSYTLAGGQCRLSIYALIIRNNQDPQQVAVFARLGDGKSKDVVFNQDLPFTPLQHSESGELVPGEAGLCVIGVTTRGFRIDDIAPDPQDAPCEPLKGGTARAFH